MSAETKTAATPEGLPKELSIIEAVAYAQALYDDKRFAGSEEVCNRVLAASPDQPDALHMLGILCFQTGRPERAVELLRRVVQAAPDFADAQNNLGNVLQHLKRYDEAVVAYKCALAIRPDMADPFFNLGRLYHLLGRDDDSTASYREAILHVDLDDVSSYRRLGTTLYACGMVEQARLVYQKWLDKEPGNELARHLLAACTGENVPARTSDQSVRDQFGAFAESFDEVLAKLRYAAPEMVKRSILHEIGEPKGADLMVLDAGCGTGLCGQHLRPYARRLVGVDLSPEMIKKAEPRGLYDELKVAELTEYLQAQEPGTWDLIASADTLVYFGDLRPVMQAAGRALRPGGRFVFTVEAAHEADAPTGYRIHPHGRYSHTQTYLQQTTASVDTLELRLIARVHLRIELGKPVQGWVVAVRRREAG